MFSDIPYYINNNLSIIIVLVNRYILLLYCNFRLDLDMYLLLLFTVMNKKNNLFYRGKGFAEPCKIIDT